MIYNMKFPMISVVMSVYNGAPFLSEAIESILNQTIEDFEFLIIDDASTDDSLNLIQSFKDPRIRVIQNSENLGLTRSLNKGLKAAQGKYIARMDADDISFSVRFEKQLDVFKNDSDVILCGTGCQIFGNEERIERVPSDSKEIKCRLLFGNVFVHSSVMLQKASFSEKQFFYDENFNFVEDYDLWTRISFEGKMVNISEPLIYYRNHDAQKTAEYNNLRRDKVKKEIVQILSHQLKRIKLNFSESDLEVHLNLCSLPFELSPSCFNLQQIEEWMERIQSANQKNPLFSESLLMQVMSERWLRATRDGIVDSPMARACLRCLIRKNNLNDSEKYGIASVYKRLHHYEESKRLFEEIAVSGDADKFPGLWFHLGEIALIHSHKKMAEQYFNKCLEVCPDHQKTLNFLAEFKAENKG